MSGIADFVPDTVHRALAYVDALNRQGYQPSATEVEKFATRPAPREAIYDDMWSRIATLGNVNRVLGGRTLRERAEPVVGYMNDLGWIQRGSDPARVTLTECGLSLLHALSQVEDHAGDALQVTLDPKDPLVYTKLTRTVASAKDGFLADAYFKADFIPWLVEATTVSRLLVKDTSEKIPLALALGSVVGSRAVEVRMTTDKGLHDRCLIPAAGSVMLFGHSINGVGKALTTVTPLGDGAGDAYRRQYEELWRTASKIEPSTLTAMSTASSGEDAASSDGDVVSPEGTDSEN